MRRSSVNIKSSSLVAFCATFVSEKEVTPLPSGDPALFPLARRLGVPQAQVRKLDPPGFVRDVGHVAR